MAVTAVSQSDRADADIVVLHVVPGAGGQEANRFVLELARMYEAYARLKGWAVQCEQQSTDMTTTTRSTIVLIVSGVLAARRLGFEIGVHRVQREPAGELHGRVHTSTASVIVKVLDELAGSELSSHDDRLEKIRTYNFPDDRVTDHRIRLTVPGVREVLDGDLDPVIDGLLGR